MIVSLAEAREKGLTHYFTGNPCKLGHVAKRQVSNRGCVVCLKQKATDWALKNPERAKDINLKWNLANKEKTSLRMRNFRVLNKDSVKKSIQKWRDKNKLKYATYMTLAATERRLAKLDRTPKWLSQFDVLAIKCKYSVCAMLNKHGVEKWHVDHIVPLRGQNVSGLHVFWNLQVIPASKNMRKSNRLLKA
jgi:hypothetical protein